MEKVKKLWLMIKLFVASIPGRLSCLSKETLLSVLVGLILTMVFGIPSFIRPLALIGGAACGWALEAYGIMNIKRNSAIIGAFIAQVFLWLF